VATQFLVSTRHHMDILLKPTLAAFNEGLQPYHNVQASDQYLKGKVPSMGDLLFYAKKSLTRLHAFWEVMIEKIGERNYVISPGSTVPTASPRALLIRLLVNHPIILQQITTGDETVLGEF
jgi:hypothetical protein